MADVEHRASASAGRNERISSKEKARPSNLAMNKDGKGGHSQMVNPIAKGTPLSPRTPHGLRTYSHALSMARAQAAARISRGGGPKSPRRKKIILEFLAEASWYHPGRTKLKEARRGSPARSTTRRCTRSSRMARRRRLSTTWTFTAPCSSAVDRRGLRDLRGRRSRRRSPKMNGPRPRALWSGCWRGRTRRTPASRRTTRTSCGCRSIPRDVRNWK
mmetsp:Transcript_55964/g.181402  ORF Transcript_55964/g.181402 Transcript_55964/m.181402 type:complete len:217 (+) Transcript_55964:95-745(+)